MNQSDTPSPLTDDELNRLLAPVPLAQQQRDALVRITLRPGLPADYAGPVELADLRLMLSPWQWLEHELATTPHTEALNQKWTRELADAGVEGSTLQDIGAWLYAEKASSDDENNLYAAIIPGDSMEWGHYGVVSDRDRHFLPPAFDLQVAMFFADESMSEGIVVAQAVWGLGKVKATSPVSIYAMPGDSQHEWLHNTDELWLSDSSTGETFKLDVGGNEVEQSENPGDWTGAMPTLDRYKFASADQDFPALLTGLRYEAGQLYRADTNALLTLGLPHPESVRA